MDCKMVGMLPIRGNDSIRRVYSTSALAPSVVTNGGGNHEIKVVLWGGVLERRHQMEERNGTSKTESMIRKA